MRTGIKWAAAAALALSVAGGAVAATYSQLVVFGDSLSDAGNAAALSGNQFPPSPLPYAGTFSNGKTAAQYLAEGLGIQWTLGWGATSSAASNNFAVGGAMTGLGNFNAVVNSPAGVASIPQLPQTGMAQQIGRYASFHPTVPDPSGTLFMLWGGPNNVFLGSALGQDLNLVVQQAVDALEQDIRLLAQMGAVHFLVPTMPNLGKTPEGLGMGAAGAAGLSLVTAGFNQLLALAVQDLLTDPTLPTLDVRMPDANAVLSQILASPAAYGFTNTTDRCFDVANPATINNVLGGCAGYLFFDGVHPTTAAHAVFGAALLAAAVPEPGSAGLLLAAALAGAGVARRRRAHVPA